MRTKTKDFYLSTSACNYDVISICETNLCSSIYDSELFDKNQYIVYRCDRSHLNSLNASWGGVLLAIRSSLSSERILVPGTDDVEVVFVKLNFTNHNVYLASMYLPLGSDVGTYERCGEALQKFFDFIRCYVDDSIFILGDFNMADVFWSNDLERPLLPSEIRSSGDRELICSLLGADLSQVNFVKNFQGKFLDLIFSILRKASVPMSKVDFNFHEPIEFSYEFSDVDQMVPEADSQFYDFRNADYDGIDGFFDYINWEQLLNGCISVNDAVDLFYDKLSDGFERFVPVLTRKISSYSPWYTRTIINLKNRKSRAHKKLSKPHTLADKIKFSSLNKEFIAKQKLAYESYLHDLQNDLADNPRNFRKYVGSKKKTRGYPASMYLKEKKAAVPEGICDLFGEFFQSVYVEDVSPSSDFGVKKLADFRSFVLSERRHLRVLT